MEELEDTGSEVAMEGEGYGGGSGISGRRQGGVQGNGHGRMGGRRARAGLARVKGEKAPPPRLYFFPLFRG